MERAISLPEKLVYKISEVAKKEGFDKPEDFVIRVLEEKLLELEEKEKIFEISDQVCTALEAKAITEKETLSEPG